MRKGRTLTKNDCERIQRLIEDGDGFARTDGNSLESLKDCIVKSRQVEQNKIKPNIVTMNSVFTLKDIGNGKKETYSLVFPKDIDQNENRISVCSRMGAQVLGCSVGTVIKGAAGINQYLLIEDIVYQPEAAGDFHL